MSNGIKPSDEEDDAVNDTPAVVVRAPDQIWLCVGDMYDCRGCEVEFDDIKSSFEVSWCEEQIDESDVKYVRADLYEKLEAELQRRQQQASVPARLVRQWCRQWNDLPDPSPESRSITEYVADKAAAYGREQSQWVPVSERLPEDGKTVIFWIRPAGYASVGKLDIDSRCFHSVGGWVNQDDVSHWMPLPEPPTC